MLSITKPKPNRIELKFEGGIDAAIMTAALDELVEAAKDMENGTVLYTVSDFEMPTIGAFGVEMARLPKLFGLLSKFSKCAVLSDSTWIRTIGELEGALLPGLAIKSFHLDEREAAENWLDENKDEQIIF